MAVDMFLKFESGKKLNGESRDKVHVGTIDVLAWSWGASNAGTAHLGGGAGAGKVNVQDMSITKYVDKASPDLILACCKGTHYTDALLTVRKAGDKPLEYLKIKMEEVMVTSVSTGGSGGEDRLTENVSLNFGKVTVDYTEQTAGGGEGAKPSIMYNIAENSAE